MQAGQPLSTIVRTLLSVGFRIANTQQKPSYIILSAMRFDEFGVESKYAFACVDPDRTLSAEDVEALEKAAQYEGSVLVIVGTIAVARKTGLLTLDEFLGRSGGPVAVLLPLEPEYPNRLTMLGHNALPAGLTGKPDTVFEEYVHAGLQFILQDRVVRYGQDRLFEALPDGLVAGHRSPLMLYDAKAAKDGYDITATTIRQFADYVRTFHQRYETYTGRLYAFLLISGHFESEGTLEERSSQLFAECGVPLRTLKAEEMAKVVAVFADRPSYRQAIDWKAVFSKTVVTANDVELNLKARIKDKVIESATF